jgi:hypothetical protein
MISVFALLSFFFQTASSILSIPCFSQSIKNIPKPNQGKQKKPLRSFELAFKKAFPFFYPFQASAK